MDSEYLEVWLLSGLTPKTLKFAENQDTARKYWEQIFKEDGASGMPQTTSSLGGENEMVRPTRDGRSIPKESKSFKLVAAQEDRPRPA